MNQTTNAKTLIDADCASYGIILSRFAVNDLKRIQIDTRAVRGFNGSEEPISEVACVDIDMGGHERHRVFLYIVRELRGYDIILGRPWLGEQEAVIDTSSKQMSFKKTGIIIGEATRTAAADIEPIGAKVYAYWEKNRRQTRHKGVETFAVSLADIDKALKPKTRTDPKQKLPRHYHEFLNVFNHKPAGILPPCRGTGIDHHIEVEKDPHKNRERSPLGAPLFHVPG